MATDPALRFRIDFGSRCSVGIGKIELLEGIASTGSLSQAARAMRMSYRRAWLLLEDMNASFDVRVATTTTGGRGGGGAELTEFGERLVAGYRGLEAGLRPLAQRHLRGIGGHAKTRRAKAPIRPAPISRPAPRGSAGKSR